jgi:hypothetical protein
MLLGSAPSESEAWQVVGVGPHDKLKNADRVRLTTSTQPDLHPRHTDDPERVLIVSLDTVQAA